MDGVYWGRDISKNHVDLFLSKIATASGLQDEAKGSLDFGDSYGKAETLISFGSLSSFTIVTYVVPVTSQSQVLFDVYDTQGNNFILYVKLENGLLYLAFKFPQVGRYRQTHTAIVNQSEAWHSLAVVYDNETEHVQLFQSGKVLIVDNVGPGNFTTISKIRVGTHVSGSGSKFRGKMTCTQFYNNALSTKEMETLYMVLNHSCSAEKFGINLTTSDGK